MRLDDLLADLHLALSGGKVAIRWLDLLGVDQGLSVETHLRRLAALGFQLLRVVKIEAHPVQRHHPVGPSAHEHVRQRVEEGLPARHVLAPQVLGKVRRPHHHALQPRLPRLCNVLCPQDPHRRLNHGPHPNLLRDPHVVHRLDRVVHLLRPLHLGQHDGTGHRRADDLQVLAVPLCVGPVEPHNHLLVRTKPRPHRRRRRLPCHRLGVWGDGVLQIDRYDVGADALALLQRLGV
mmetsp:Transcript_41802/g.104518  ORF Transcript_41802/g.104518 Transcript_41802/m.104518 type:complete len:235 (-) Transcript_41802:135-839(-)